MMLRSSTFAFALATLVAAAASACGGATPVAPTSPTPAASDSASPVASAPATSTPAPAGPVWNRNASKDEQMAFMKTRVIPPMSKVFQAHDGARYATFGCVTCHGPQYKEPKEFLPHLTFKDGKITSFADKPEISKFMMEKVVPEMAAAMGMKPYDPKTHEGFGCGGCHTVDMK